MLSNKMINKINEQINLEFFSSNLYLQMSAWCQAKSFEGTAIFLRAHALEEMEHMNKFFYIPKRNRQHPFIRNYKGTYL